MAQKKDHGVLSQSVLGLEHDVSHLLAMWTWTSCLTFMNLGFFSCKMGVIGRIAWRRGNIGKASNNSTSYYGDYNSSDVCIILSQMNATSNLIYKTQRWQRSEWFGTFFGVISERGQISTWASKDGSILEKENDEGRSSSPRIKLRRKEKNWKRKNKLHLFRRELGEQLEWRSLK